jgi:hypothetical protein
LSILLPPSRKAGLEQCCLRRWIVRAADEDKDRQDDNLKDQKCQAPVASDRSGKRVSLERHWDVQQPAVTLHLIIQRLVSSNAWTLSAQIE